MTWNEKYWDMISNIYWTPRFIGLESIPTGTCKGPEALLPASLMKAKGDRAYIRQRKHSDLLRHLGSQEEPLNHVFNIACAIASDQVLSQLLCQPLRIQDNGPFRSWGRELLLRFGFRESDNVTQHDGFFTTPTSLIGVELKLDSSTWPGQIAKYLALMVWKEQVSKTRNNLGLLFIVPERALQKIWSKAGLSGPSLDSEFILRLKGRGDLKGKVQELFEKNTEQLAYAASRLQLAAVSWSWLRDELEQIESELDSASSGNQTLVRLLAGLRAQIECHGKTGVSKKAV